MSLKTKKILKIDVTVSPKTEILEEIRKDLEKGKRQKAKGKSEEQKPYIIFTPNPEIISYAQKDEEFRRIVNTAQINIPDGYGIVWAIKKIYGMDVGRIAGVDFMLNLVKLAQKESLTIGLIGGRGGLAVRTAECLRQKYSGLRIEVFDAPEMEIGIKNQESRIKNNKNHNFYFQIHNSNDGEVINTDKYFQNLVESIMNKRINILFVAMGFPKQEYFINQLNQQLTITNYQSPIVLMAVGGAFDYVSGRVPRAPLFIRNIGLEWLYRLVIEPWRLSRQLRGADFFWKVLISLKDTGLSQ